MDFPEAVAVAVVAVVGALVEMKKWWVVIIFLIIGLIRMVNIGQTSRFVWDESSDLVRMKDLWSRPRLTMIGPISEDNTKVFGSLTYYLSIPFVVIGNFEPISAVWATIFFGILTVIFLVLAAKNEKIGWREILLLSGSSIPLIEASRWAWNPHFIPFWQALGLWLWSKKTKWGEIAGGLCWGLAIHHHYYALLAVIGMIAWKKFNLKILLGVIIAILPFGVFDLTHPPGLFISRALFFNPMLANETKNLVWPMIGGLVASIFFWQKTKNGIWLVVSAQILGLLMIKSKVYNHYFLAAVIPFYWGIIQIKSDIWRKIITGILVLVSVLTWPKVLFKNSWEGNINEVTQLTAEMIKKAEGREFNIAVLGSPDPNTKGRRYRDLLELNGIKVADINNYDQELMFFISTKEWDELIEDPSYEMNNCRSVKAEKIIETTTYHWKLYACDRQKNSP